MLRLAVKVTCSKPLLFCGNPTIPFDFLTCFESLVPGDVPPGCHFVVGFGLQQRFQKRPLNFTLRLLSPGSLKQNWPIKLQDKNNEFQPKLIEPFTSRRKTKVKTLNFGITAKPIKSPKLHSTNPVFNNNA